MRIILIIALLATAAGCQNKPDTRSKATPRSETELIELNRSMISQDRDAINTFLKKTTREFTETNTGLWYSIIENGSGPTVKTGDNVSFDFECTLLNGNPCYSGTQTIRVGFSDAGSGVTEGLQMMQKGSDYLFIIPPYLAYGLTGDGGKIPGRAILVYRIRIKDIS
ncbi:MAG: FKBP-type peptidyl-prolyl cis-trans isomerase [Bacteroidales bacterium]|jgi:FKBP-type peptidyl-prolyl cis-trans isomerase|nr:FKBP-type peptidyl-prolyl cis-trans isomerase [Bacteroidales bacterium]